MDGCADDGMQVEAWHDLMARWAPYRIALANLAITHFAKSTNLTHACFVITQLARSTNYSRLHIFQNIIIIVINV